MNTYKNTEESLVHEYIKKCSDEVMLEQWIINQKKLPSLITVQGFEERSLGILEAFANHKINVSNLIIARYINKEINDPNDRFRDRFEKAAEKISPKKWDMVTIDNEGIWFSKAIQHINTEEIIIDITGLSNTLLFGILDRAAECNKKIIIGYSEAGEYFPKKYDWEKTISELTERDPAVLAKIVDNKPWLFSHENKVELVLGHEGYDVAGNKRALIGFLTFKCARLAAIIMEEGYSKYFFIAGVPRLKENEWRLSALRDINSAITASWPIYLISTFKYRDTTRRLVKLLFDRYPLLEEYNVSLAALGSKLQTVGCWAISRICKSITIVTSVPVRYYPDAFSDGIGQTWIFPLTKPPL